MIASLIEKKEIDEVERRDEYSGVTTGPDFVDETITTTKTETDVADCPRCGHRRVFTKTVAVNDSKGNTLALIAGFMLLSGPLVVVLQGRVISLELLSLILPRLIAAPLAYVGWLIVGPKDA